MLQGDEGEGHLGKTHFRYLFFSSFFFSSFFFSGFFSSLDFGTDPEVLGSSSLIDARLFFSFFFETLTCYTLTDRDLDRDLEWDRFFRALFPWLFLLSLEPFTASFNRFVIGSGFFGCSACGGVALSFFIVIARLSFTLPWTDGYVGIVYCPQFVTAGLITLDDLFDCDEVLPFLTTSTLVVLGWRWSFIDLHCQGGQVDLARCDCILIVAPLFRCLCHTVCLGARLW